MSLAIAVLTPLRLLRGTVLLTDRANSLRGQQLAVLGVAEGLHVLLGARFFPRHPRAPRRSHKRLIALKRAAAEHFIPVELRGVAASQNDLAAMALLDWRHVPNERVLVEAKVLLLNSRAPARALL